MVKRQFGELQKIGSKVDYGEKWLKVMEKWRGEKTLNYG